uniref:DUF3778 domain-containing protein n=1 Tax=Oryza rufipogon TaxID=4529 RepID=A0A0E0PQ57_ORYRU
MGAGVVGGGGGWWRWRCEIRRPVDELTLASCGGVGFIACGRGVGFFVACGLGVDYFVVSGHGVGCFVVSGHGVGCFVIYGHSVGCFVWLGGHRPISCDGCGDFSWLASSGAIVAQSLLLVVLDDNPSAWWRRFHWCQFESSQCLGSISQDS